jgi:hypothetical protein
MGRHAALLALVLQACATLARAEESKNPLDMTADECEAKAASVIEAARDRALWDCLRGYPDDPPKTPAPIVDYFVNTFSHTINSVGGVEPTGTFTNPNNASAIKYISLQVRMFNAVGDVIRSTVGGRSTATLEVTGPIASEDGPQRAEWEPVWYNATATCVRIDAVRVQFMNGKVQTFQGANLRKALSPGIPNDCRVNVR